MMHLLHEHAVIMLNYIIYVYTYIRTYVDIYQTDLSLLSRKGYCGYGNREIIWIEAFYCIRYGAYEPPERGWLISS